MKKLLLLTFVFLTGCVGEVPFDDVQNAVNGLIPPDAITQYQNTGGHTIELTDVSPGVVVTSSVVTGRDANGITFPMICSTGQTVTSQWSLDPDKYTLEERTYWYSQTIIINYNPGAFICGHYYAVNGYTESGIYTATTAELVQGYGVKLRIVFTDKGVQ